MNQDEETGRMLRYMQQHGTSVSLKWSASAGLWEADWWNDWGRPAWGQGNTPFEAVLAARNEGHGMGGPTQD